VAHVIAPLLGLNEAAVAQRLTPRTYVGKNSKGETVTNEFRYVVLAKNVPEPVWQQVHAAMTNFARGTLPKKLTKAEAHFWDDLRQEAVFPESDQLRVYVNGSLAGQVVGFPSVEETNVAGRVVSRIVGQDGIEKTFQRQLSGVAGWRVTETDKKQRELLWMQDEDVRAHDGKDVVLTIDSAVQNAVETELAQAMQRYTPKSITGIVMRPRTGEILAMASLPNYDPNQPRTITTETRNRVIDDVVEPGSTFKIVVVSGALEDSVVKLTDEFDCEHGHFYFAGRTLRDHEHDLGMTTVKDIIAKSSNIGAAKIGIKLGADNLYKYAWNFGFGQRTGIPLPGEAKGILYPVKDWSKVSIAQIPMGQGVAVTRLQMTYAMAAIANGGWLMEPMIVSRLQEHDRSVVVRYTPQRVRQVVSTSTCKEIIEALKAVAAKGGTAAEAALKDYVVAGKTGTAQKAENGTYAEGKHLASFIGFFPADKPEVCISVVMDEPKESVGYYGGKVCAPVFHDIAERCASYLNIPPDPSLTATNAPAPLVAATNQPKSAN
jgi:cell division protein FtsI/penicillin-binding protein 2